MSTHRYTHCVYYVYWQHDVWLLFSKCKVLQPNDCFWSSCAEGEDASAELCWLNGLKRSWSSRGGRELTLSSPSGCVLQTLKQYVLFGGHNQDIPAYSATSVKIFIMCIPKMNWITDALPIRLYASQHVCHCDITCGVQAHPAEILTAVYKVAPWYNLGVL